MRASSSTLADLAASAWLLLWLDEPSDEDEDDEDEDEADDEDDAVLVRLSACCASTCLKVLISELSMVPSLLTSMALSKSSIVCCDACVLSQPSVELSEPLASLAPADRCLAKSIVLGGGGIMLCMALSISD